jgi:hypothetical protein
LKILIEKTDHRLKVSVKFIDIYKEACDILASSNDKHDDSIVLLRHSVGNTLPNDGHIFVDPRDVDLSF